MKKAWISGLLVLGVSALFVAAGCGRSGAGAAPPATAVVKLYVDGVSTGNQIGGAQVTLHLAPGVSVKATQAPPQTDPGVVAASNGADLDFGIYSSSTGSVTVRVVKAVGFDVGELATVTCDIGAGYLPTASQFSVSGLTVWDLDGNESTITGVQPNLAVSFN